MSTSNLKDEFNMRMAAISILNSVVNDIEDKIQNLKKSAEEIKEKISNEEIRESEEICPKCQSEDIMSYTPFDDMCNKCGHIWGKLTKRT